ncbi:MAG TPA: hypothetical protein VF765_13015 [Polyangiaceae bacterium]
MATPFVENRPVVAPPLHRNRAGGAVEALCAVAGIVLAIIGLAGASRFFDAIADIVVGAAFLFEVWTLTARGHDDRGMWAERAAGWTGVVLGILALLGLAPTVFAPISVIVFGAGLIFGVGLLSRAARVVAGLCAVVLGILALLQLDPRTLTNIAVIAVAGILLVTGPAVARSTHGMRGMRAPAI